MRLVVALVVAVGLAGCAGKPVEQMTYSETNQLAAEINARCEKQGAGYGKPNFDACIRQEVTREKSLRNEQAEQRRRSVGCVSNNVYGNIQTICG